MPARRQTIVDGFPQLFQDVVFDRRFQTSELSATGWLYGWLSTRLTDSTFCSPSRGATVVPRYTIARRYIGKSSVLAVLVFVQLFQHLANLRIVRL